MIKINRTLDNVNSATILPRPLYQQINKNELILDLESEELGKSSPPTAMINLDKTVKNNHYRIYKLKRSYSKRTFKFQ